MPNQAKPKAGSIPNLAGIIKAEDLYKKMKFDYVPWAKTAQLLREHADGWMFHLQSNKTQNDLFDYVFTAPNGTGYLMGFYEHIETGKKGPLYPFAITNNSNQPIKLEQLSSTHIQNSHRRCLCACACFTFGLAYELWAQIEIQEANEPAPIPVKKEIARSPQRGANAKQVKPSPVAHEMVTGKAAQASIPQSQKDALAKELQTLPPHGRNRVISSFRQEYKISSEKISEFITTPEHLSFIKSKIAEVESDSP